MIPQVQYYTNDAWEVVSAARPLTGGVSGYPILLRAPYAAGNLYVLTIPDDMGNLYDFPAKALNEIRRIMSRDMDIYLEAPPKSDCLCMTIKHWWWRTSMMNRWKCVLLPMMR